MNNEEKILGLLETLAKDVTDLKSDVSSLKSDVSSLKSDVSSLKSDVSSLKVGQAKADDFISFARNSMYIMQHEQLPGIKGVMESYDGHTERLEKHDRRIFKLENLVEDHSTRVWVLEQAARK
ncbi:MAG: hypothetical protein LBR85_08165 [Oscillospiraceae bacterium]|jgi:outer membrane murein-binding lipoprotein Lpp|nr:hypothetical protein [Oscillospiraceae bacterium]